MWLVSLPSASSSLASQPNDAKVEAAPGSGWVGQLHPARSAHPESVTQSWLLGISTWVAKLCHETRRMLHIHPRLRVDQHLVHRILLWNSHDHWPSTTSQTSSDLKINAVEFGAFLMWGCKWQLTRQVGPTDVFRLAYRVFKLIVISLIWWPTFLNQEISYLNNPDFKLLKNKTKLMSRRFGSYGPDFLQGHSWLEQNSG